MAASPWRVVLTDRSYVPKGELSNVGSFQYQRSLSKLATCSFSARMDNPHVNRLADADGFIKLYRGTSHRYTGPIITAEQVIERSAQSLAITSADIGWMLTKRLAGKSATGTQFTTATDLAQIAKSLIDTTNTMSETGLSTAVGTLSAGSARTYTAGPYRLILEIVQELGSALDGFDWRVVAVENWVNGAISGTKSGYLEAAPVIGTSKPTAIFEYGKDTRSNILSFNKIRSRDGQADRVFHVGSDPALAMSADNASAQATWGILEDVISTTDITDTNMRTGLLNEHVGVRGTPRDLVRIVPHIDPGVTGRMPIPFVDYDVGDTITARIVNAGQVRFAGLLRVFGINITVEQETGFERIELILEDDS